MWIIPRKALDLAASPVLPLLGAGPLEDERTLWRLNLGVGTNMAARYYDVGPGTVFPTQLIVDTGQFLNYHQGPVNLLVNFELSPNLLAEFCLKVRSPGQ